MIKLLLIKKYLKSLGICFVLLLFLNLLITLLNYINIVNLQFINVFSYVIAFISCFISSLYLGKNSNNTGYIEGIKLGLIIIIIFILINYLLINSVFKLNNIIIYIIILISSIIGSMLGINLKKDN